MHSSIYSFLVSFTDVDGTRCARAAEFTFSKVAFESKDLKLFVSVGENDKDNAKFNWYEPCCRRVPRNPSISVHDDDTDVDADDDALLSKYNSFRGVPSYTGTEVHLLPLSACPCPCPCPCSVPFPFAFRNVHSQTNYVYHYSYYH